MCVLVVQRRGGVRMCACGAKGSVGVRVCARSAKGVGSVRVCVHVVQRGVSGRGVCACATACVCLIMGLYACVGTRV
jgi:hypothetical protein